MVHEWRRGEYSISTDKGRLDVAVIHGFLPLSIRCWKAQWLAASRAAKRCGSVTH